MLEAPLASSISTLNEVTGIDFECIMSMLSLFNNVVSPLGGYTRPKKYGKINLSHLETISKTHTQKINFKLYLKAVYFQIKPKHKETSTWRSNINDHNGQRRQKVKDRCLIFLLMKLYR